ncbi:hypothetical protein SELMODRAFT_123808 [Selaginella moellendorffii]|uniref:UspA domain-containing protein n=1 Tax=Selaginella moellendorffii TaxID=88036 RepID=D8SST9_SELML|nr:hypothetical protein SELMODRAFT_123808 [Selaginella moellendorffii]
MISFSTKLIVSKKGDAQEKLLEAVNEWPPTMLILGSRGIGMVKRTFLGSVSDYAAQHAECPVPCQASTAVRFYVFQMPFFSFSFEGPISGAFFSRHFLKFTFRKQIDSLVQDQNSVFLDPQSDTSTVSVN